MADAGPSLMGIGSASGENRATEAARAAISSPLLETTISGAKGVLLNITGGPDLGLFEIDEAAAIISSAASEDCNVIFGAVIDETGGDHLRVTVIATGFSGEPVEAAVQAPVRRAAGRSTKQEESEPAAQPGRRLSLGAADRDSFGIPDDALEIPDFLKNR